MFPDEASVAILPSGVLIKKLKCGQRPAEELRPRFGKRTSPSSSSPPQFPEEVQEPPPPIEEEQVLAGIQGHRAERKKPRKQTISFATGGEENSNAPSTKSKSFAGNYVKLNINGRGSRPHKFSNRVKPRKRRFKGKKKSEAGQSSQ